VLSPAKGRGILHGKETLQVRLKERRDQGKEKRLSLILTKKPKCSISLNMHGWKKDSRKDNQLCVSVGSQTQPKSEIEKTRNEKKRRRS